METECFLGCCSRYENTEKRSVKVAEKGIMYMGMGVSGGEEGARNGVLAYCSLSVQVMLSNKRL
jgi:6-phosphogluconate dehydrogenase